MKNNFRNGYIQTWRYTVNFIRTCKLGTDKNSLCDEFTRLAAKDGISAILDIVDCYDNDLCCRL